MMISLLCAGYVGQSTGRRSNFLRDSDKPADLTLLGLLCSRTPNTRGSNLFKWFSAGFLTFFKLHFIPSLPVSVLCLCLFYSPKQWNIKDVKEVCVYVVSYCILNSCAALFSFIDESSIVKF